MPYKKKMPGKPLRWVGRVQKDGAVRQKVFDTKTEALAWEAEQRTTDWGAAAGPTPIVTALDWANEYLDWARERFSKKTYDEKRDAFARLFRVLSRERPVEEVTPPIAAKVLRHEARVRSGHAANKDRKNLVAAWNWGCKFLALPKENPFAVVDRFAEERKPRYVPSEEDFQKVLAQAQGQDRTMLLFLLHTAARKGEVFRLRWDDLDFQDSRIRLWTRKRTGGTMEYDWIPMTSELRSALLEQRTQANSVFVFSRPTSGKPYRHRQHLLRYLCGLAEVKVFTLHAIRHLTASILDKAGLDLSTIQAILRHKSATTTARYLHSLRGTKAALDEVFSGKVVEMKREGSRERTAS